MEEPIDERLLDDNDDDPEAGYVILVYRESQVSNVLVSTTYDIAYQMAEAELLGDDHIDHVVVNPLKFNTTNQSETVH